MRGLTPAEYEGLREARAVEDGTENPGAFARGWNDPAVEIRNQLAEQGRVGPWRESRFGYCRRPLTPQGRLALDLWPRVRRYFEGA